MDNYGTHKHPKVQSWLTTASTFCTSLHSDQFKLAEFGRALVWRTDGKTHTSWCLRQCR